MKKIIALLMIVVLSALLCACGTDNIPSASEVAESNAVNPSSSSNQPSEEQSSVVVPASSQPESMEESKVSSSFEASSEVDSILEPTLSSESVSSSRPAESSKPVSSSRPAESSKPVSSSSFIQSSKPQHTHIFVAATCVEPQKCSCGETVGKALGHSFSNATCTEPKKCKTCGTIEGSSLGHKFTEATCTTKKTCSVCKVTEGELGEHKFTNGECTVCKEIDNDNYELVYSKNNTFSALIPKQLNADISKGFMGDDSIDLLSPDIDFEYVVTRTIILKAIENANVAKYEEEWVATFGDQFGSTTKEDMGFKTQKVISNDKYTIYCEYIYKRSYASGIEEALKDFNAVLDAKDEILKTVKFN